MLLKSKKKKRKNKQKQMGPTGGKVQLKNTLADY